MIDQKYFGFYRGRVTAVDLPDYKKYGAVKVFIPIIMDPERDEDLNEFKDGLIAYPANNPVGGRNAEGNSECYYQGSVYVPALNSHVWVFFEGGCINSPHYFAAFDSKCSMLPPENRVNDEGADLEEPHKVYTILKTHSGRSIIVSDSEDVQRIEICGKKRNIKYDTSDINGSKIDPSGDYESAYTIDDNMTTILFDEREKKEKLLIRTRKGDYVHIDIDEQNLHLNFANDINIKCAGNLSIQVSGDIQTKCNGNTYLTTDRNLHLKANNGASYLNSKKNVNIRSESEVNIDGILVNKQCGKSSPATAATPTNPIGDRDD